MRGYATFFVTAVMSLALVFVLLTRSRTPHDAPLEIVSVDVDGGAGDGGAGDGGAGDGGASGVAESADAAVAPVARPLRVTTLGWELAAPAVSLAASADAGAPLVVEVAPEHSLDAVEARLARGGGDVVGADVAVLPLPAFVVAYQRLRALDPRVFAVVGYSRGREEMRGAPGALLKAPPAADEVRLVGFSRASREEGGAAGSESATLLGLFTLDLLGVTSARIRVVAPASADAKGASFAALVRGASDERKIAFSTADASRLVPLVAVAPRGVIEGRDVALRDFTRAWLDGLVAASADASTVARKLANKEIPLGAGVPGAPEAIALLERLGQIESVSASAQRSLLGPEAKGAARLEVIAARTWQLTRAAGLTTDAAPSPLPLDARVVAAMTGDPAPTPAAAPGAFGAVPAGATPLVVYRVTDAAVTPAETAGQIALLASVFERALLRVAAKGGEKAALAIAETAKTEHAVAPSRLVVAPAEPSQGALVTVEILAPP